MALNLPQRLKSAWNMVWKGSLFPFDRLTPGESTGMAERLTEPYAHSVWVMRAIKKVAGPIGAVSLQFSDQQRRGDRLYENPALDQFWQRPTADLSYVDFIEATTGWLKMEGEAFWLMDDAWLMPSFTPAAESPRRLVVARPDRMRHIVKGGELMGWEFTDGKGGRHAVLPEQVVHLKFWNPYDDWRGLAEYKAAEIAAESDYLAGRFKRNLMANNGDQGVYVIGKNGIPTDDQRQMITQQLRMKRELQQRGIFRPLFLAGDIQIEDAHISAPDANFVANRLSDRHEIFLAFGVPPSMADKMESYSIGSASDWFMLIMETCLPTSVKICEGIEVVSRRLTNLPLYAWANFDEHPVMQAARRERFEAIDQLWSKGMPMREISSYLDLALPEFPGWDTGYLPFSVAAVGSAEMGDPATNPAFAEDDEPEAVTEMLRTLRSPRSGEAPQTFQRGRDPGEVAQWREQMAKRRGTMKAFASRFNRELMKARREVLSKIESFTASGRAAVLGGLGQRAAAADFNFDLETFREGLLVSLRKVTATALQMAGKQLFEEIQRDDPFTMPPEQVLQFVRSRQNKISGLADDIHARIKSTLEEALAAGETMEKIADRIRAEFNTISDDRAQTIAQTETSAAYGAGRQVAMVQAGVQWKRWLTSGNDNVRPAHAQANGQTVEVGEHFDVGGEPLIHPGDPAGSPGNVINCHCVAISVAEENE